jgi:hypothetical protein
MLDAPGGKFAIVKQRLSGSPDRVATVEALEQKAREKLASECDERPWTVDKRRCVAASTTQDAYVDCH